MQNITSVDYSSGSSTSMLGTAIAVTAKSDLEFLEYLKSNRVPFTMGNSPPGLVVYCELLNYWGTKPSNIRLVIRKNVFRHDSNPEIHKLELVNRFIVVCPLKNTKIYMV